jgi:hypothetical protein
MSAPCWQRYYLAGLAVLFVAHAIGRLAFYNSVFIIFRIDIVLHAMVLASLLGAIALIVAAFPDRGRGRILAATFAVAALSGLHALLTVLDAVQGLMMYLTGIAAPFRLMTSDRPLLLSLIYSAGLTPWMIALALASFWAVHILLYLPVAGPLVDASRLAMARPVRRFGKHTLTVAWIVLVFGVATVALHQVRSLLWLRFESFSIAPAELMKAQGKPVTTQQPVTPLLGARPLVLIIVDALRRDRMGVYVPRLDNTPFLSGLRDQGNLHVFGPAYSSCTFSYCGIIGVLSSHSWNNFGSRPATIVDALGRHQYRSYLMLAGHHLDFGNMPKLFGGPVAALKDETSEVDSKSDDRRVLRWLRETSFPDPRHSFLYLHLMTTHAGAMLQPAYLRAASDTTGLVTGKDYDARVRQTDDILRQLFVILREKGLGDAVVAITADHGERLGEDGKLFHGGPPDLAAISVPLLIYDPSATRYPARPIVSHMDAVPTLLHAVGAPIPPGWTGEALQLASPRRAVPIGTGEATGVVAAIGGGQFRYLCNRKSGRERIARLSADSGVETELPIDRAPAGLLDTLRRLHRLSAQPIAEAKCRR